MSGNPHLTIQRLFEGLLNNITMLYCIRSFNSIRLDATWVKFEVKLRNEVHPCLVGAVE